MATISSSVASSDFLLDLMRKSLPEQTSETQNPPLKDSYAAIALFSHVCMLAVGFRLVGLGEDHKIDAQSDSKNTLPLPSEWDASSRYSTSTYAFRYKHSQSSMEYLLKVNRLGGKAVIYGLGLGHDQTAYFDVNAQDYISEGSLKEVITTDTVSALRNIFISPGRISDLSSLFKSSIIQKLAPGLQKAGAEDMATSVEQSRRTQETRQPEQDFDRGQNQIPRPANPYAFNDPLAAAPRRPIPIGDFPPPGFDDEYDLNRPPRGMPGGRQPFGNIGDRDLYPPGLGPHDPLRIGPGGGGYGGGGGMHPTFDDPIFGGQGERTQFDPRAPPGARYDPVGPGDGPPNLRGGPRFPSGRGGGGGGFGGNPFGGFGGNDFI